MSRYPDAPGHRGVDTSMEAADAISPDLGRLQRLAAMAICAAGDKGLTADELAARLKEARWSIQPRTTELQRKGIIRDSGLRRLNVTGKRAIVWVAEPRDHAAASGSRMMAMAMRTASNSAPHGHSLKLHRVPGFGEVSNLAGQPQPPERPSISDDGTNLAIRYLSIGVAVSDADRRGQRGGARNRKGRESLVLTGAQAVNLIEAAHHATAIGLPFTRMMTIHWQAAGVALDGMAAATGRFTDLLAKALARHGSRTAWLWVHENGEGKGGHCHMLVHIPVDLVKVVQRLRRQWLRIITATPFRTRVVKTDALGRRLGLEKGNPALLAENVIEALGYLLKGVTPAAPLAASLKRLEPGGRIIGKRCGTSQNIGRKARSERKAR